MDEFILWTIYDHPADYPEYFVARKWLIWNTTGEVEMTDEVLLNADLEALRKLLPYGLYRLSRTPKDDPCIVEVWI